MFGIGADEDRRRANSPAVEDEIRLASAITCSAVRIYPSLWTMTPLPAGFAAGASSRSAPQSTGAGDDHHPRKQCDSFHGRVELRR